MTKVRALLAVVLGGALAFGLAGTSDPPPVAAVPRASAHPAWAWPVAEPHAIARPFEAPPTPFAAGHRGIDIAAEPRTEVLAPAAGVVSFAGWVVDRPVLSITHTGGYVSSVEPADALVARGEPVVAGQVIGTVASADTARPHCRGKPCLHFGVRLDGEYVSPLLLLGGIPRSVLLPLRGPTVFDGE